MRFQQFVDFVSTMPNLGKKIASPGHCGGEVGGWHGEGAREAGSKHDALHDMDRPRSKMVAVKGRGMLPAFLA